MESLSCIKWTILVTLKYPFKKAALPLFEIVVVVVFGVLPRHTFVPNNTTGFWVFFFQCCLNHQPLLLLYGNAILLLFQIRQIMKEAHAKLYTIASVSCNSHFHTIRWQQTPKRMLLQFLYWLWQCCSSELADFLSLQSVPQL